MGRTNVYIRVQLTDICKVLGIHAKVKSADRSITSKQPFDSDVICYSVVSTTSGLRLSLV